MLSKERDVDYIIEDMINRTKGDYITQGVSFNKNTPRHMELLRYALDNSNSFSGLVKELLARQFDDGGIHSKGNINQRQNVKRVDMKPKSKDVGNFI